VDETVRSYMDAVLTTASFRRWHKAAMEESFVIAADEVDEEAMGPFPMPQ
jgi:glutathione S-transferase